MHFKYFKRFVKNITLDDIRFETAEKCSSREYQEVQYIGINSQPEASFGEKKPLQKLW